MPLFYFLVFLMCFSDPPLVSRVLGDSVFKIIGALCVVYALLYLAGRRGKVPNYLGTWQGRLFVGFYLVALFSYAIKSASRGDFFSSPAMIYTSFFVLLFMTLALVDSWQRLRLVLLAAIGSVALGAVVVIREWMLYHNVYRDFRPGWGLGDANYYGTSAVLCLPVGYLFLVSLKLPRLEKLFLAGSLAVGLVGVLLCASRGGFVALAFAILVTVVRSRHSVRNLVVLGLVVVPLTLLLPNSPVRRFIHPSHGDQEAVQSRLVAWKAGLRMIEKHPLVGIGLGNFKALMPVYTDPGSNIESMAHDAYLEIAAELGVPMLFVFLGIVYFSYRTLERLRRQAQSTGPPVLYEAALGLEAGLVGYAVGAAFLSAEYQKLFWLTIFLTMCMDSLAGSGATSMIPAKAAPTVFGPGRLNGGKLRGWAGQPATGTSEPPRELAAHRSRALRSSVPNSKVKDL